MYFYELLHACNDSALTEEFLKLCQNSPDFNHTREVFTEFLKNIKNLAPELSEEWTLFITKEQDQNGQDYAHVYAKNPHENENFGIEITPWKEVLGWPVNPDSLASFDREVLTAAVLWEITWFGYDETAIQKKVESWNTQHDSDKSEGDEDIL